MEKMNLTSLSQNELKEINGGRVLLVIAPLLGNYCLKRLIDFYEGVKEGYQRGVSTN